MPHYGPAFELPATVQPIASLVDDRKLNILSRHSGVEAVEGGNKCLCFRLIATQPKKGGFCSRYPPFPSYTCIYGGMS
jgi:hypothetical protein